MPMSPNRGGNSSYRFGVLVAIPPSMPSTFFGSATKNFHISEGTNRTRTSFPRIIVPTIVNHRGNIQVSIWKALAHYCFFVQVPLMSKCRKVSLFGTRME